MVKLMCVCVFSTCVSYFYRYTRGKLSECSRMVCVCPLLTLSFPSLSHIIFLLSSFIFHSYTHLLPCVSPNLFSFLCFLYLSPAPSLPSSTFSSYSLFSLPPSSPTLVPPARHLISPPPLLSSPQAGFSSLVRLAYLSRNWICTPLKEI